MIGGRKYKNHKKIIIKFSTQPRPIQICNKRTKHNYMLLSDPIKINEDNKNRRSYLDFCKKKKNQEN